MCVPRDHAHAREKIVSLLDFPRRAAQGPNPRGPTAPGGATHREKMGTDRQMAEAGQLGTAEM